MKYMNFSNRTIIILLLGFSVSIILSCNSSGSNNKSNKDTIENAIDPNAPTVVKFNGRLFSVPSPLQISMLVKDLNLPYAKEFLNPTSNQHDYTTSLKKALNLGIYGTDLGYLNIYEQLPDAASYFSVVRSLSEKIGIMNSFNEATIKRIENNNNNKDSLIYILSTIYRDADAYLMNNDQNEIGVLILAGGWVESLYFLTSYLEQTNDQEIINRIGEQKNPLNNLIALLSPYYGQQSSEMDKFIEDLATLSEVFDGVVVEYTYAPAETDEKNKITVINSKTKTVITEYQLKQIKEQVNQIRSWIVN